MKPEWELLKNQAKTITGNITILTVDSDYLSNIDYQPLSSVIQGFPALLLFKNGKLFKEYNKERTAKSMLKFLKPFLKSRSRSKLSPRIKTVKVKSIKKAKNYKKTLKLGENIGLCRHAKTGKNGCKICCSQFKKRKTYKKCKKLCKKRSMIVRLD
jgi:hypothetical protein